MCIRDRLGALGGVFTAAGVGEVIGKIVSGIVPPGNVTIGIIVFAIGMVLFTAIMGNAYGAITVKMCIRDRPRPPRNTDQEAQRVPGDGIFGSRPLFLLLLSSIV